MSYKPTLSQISKPQLAGISLGLVATAAIAFTAPAMQPQVQTVSARIAPANFAVTGLVLAHGTGSATVRLDQHNVFVSFDYQQFEDSYGAPGSEFTAFEINSLTVEKISDDNGRTYNDYTNFDDVINIKNLIVAYVYQHNLAEVE